jgi:hypothetical protein
MVDTERRLKQIEKLRKREERRGEERRAKLRKELITYSRPP